MRNLKQLLEILSDSEFHPGEAIATQLNMTHAGVWKIVKQAQTSEFDIEGVTRHGYRLISKVVFLCPKKIKQYLSIEKRNSLKLIEVFDEINSTNTYLLQKIYEYSKILRVCLAES